MQNQQMDELPPKIEKQTSDKEKITSPASNSYPTSVEAKSRKTSVTVQTSAKSTTVPESGSSDQLPEGGGNQGTEKKVYQIQCF